MKKIFYIFATIMCLFAKIGYADDLNNDKIYFFYYDACPYCHQADEYIKKNYPTLEMEKIDVYARGGREMLYKCAKKFDIEDSVGTPLFCMGDKYLLGWNEEVISDFNKYVKEFLK